MAVGALLGSLGAGAAGGSSIFSLGTLLKVGGFVFNAIGQSRAANMQAAIAEQNAQIANENANKALLKSQEDQEEQDILNSALLSEQLALQGGSGISVSGKSSKLARKTSRRLASVERERIRSGGVDVADNFRQDAANQKNTAQLNRSSGRNNLLAGFLGATTSILGSSKSTRPSGLFSRSLLS